MVIEQVLASATFCSFERAHIVVVSGQRVFAEQSTVFGTHLNIERGQNFRTSVSFPSRVGTHWQISDR